jgi:hypothetical protein
MSARAWLRTAAAVTVLFAVGHSIGTFSPPPPGGASAVAQAMQTVQFDLFGAQRTYWDLFHGYGVLIILVGAFLAVQLWQLGSLASAAVRPLVLAIAALQICFAVVGFCSFFWAPGAFNAISAACALLAAWRAGSAPPRPSMKWGETAGDAAD